jgi:hypothetical protein
VAMSRTQSNTGAATALVMVLIVLGGSPLEAHAGPFGSQSLGPFILTVPLVLLRTIGLTFSPPIHFFHRSEQHEAGLPSVQALPGRSALPASPALLLAAAAATAAAAAAMQLHLPAATALPSLPSLPASPAL